MSDVNQDFAPVCELTYVFIPVIDASAGMAGKPIANLNETMLEIREHLADFNEHHLKIDFCIAPLVYADHATWWGYTDGTLISADEYVWQDIQPSGMSRINAALDMLLSKLTTTKEGGWLEEEGGVAPIIVFFMGRTPCDDYKATLEKLWARGWYKAALKIGVVMDGEAVLPVLGELTGDVEAALSHPSSLFDALNMLLKNYPFTTRAKYYDDPFTHYTDYVSRHARISLGDTDDIF